MPRPITKKDAKYLRDTFGLRTFICKELGYYVLDPYDLIYSHAYQIQNDGKYPCWVKTKVFLRRKKLGHPKPRKKPVRQMLQDGPFSLDEMAIAEAIINGG